MDTDKKTSLAQKYFGITEDYSPTHKDMSDNLRSYLTVVAYSVAIRYTWMTQHSESMTTLVFRGIALLWGAWVLWFFVLTLLQTFHILVGLQIHFFDFLFLDTLKRLKSQNRISNIHRRIFSFIVWLSALFCIMFMSGTFYIVGALLKMAH